jgi:hypothetical protein
LQTFLAKKIDVRFFLSKERLESLMVLNWDASNGPGEKTYTRMVKSKKTKKSKTLKKNGDKLKKKNDTIAGV